MSTIINTIESYSDLFFQPPASNNEIADAEKRLSVQFAPDYRECVAEYGAVAVNGHELTGILNSERLSVVSVTIREWGLNSQVPRSMYVVENPAIDGIIIWQDVGGEIYKSSPNSAPKVIASSLVEYLTS